VVLLKSRLTPVFYSFADTVSEFVILLSRPCPRAALSSRSASDHDEGPRDAAGAICPWRNTSKDPAPAASCFLGKSQILSNKSTMLTQEKANLEK
jgi:hypothetical protein